MRANKRTSKGGDALSSKKASIAASHEAVLKYKRQFENFPATFQGLPGQHARASRGKVFTTAQKVFPSVVEKILLMTSKPSSRRQTNYVSKFIYRN